MRYVEHGVVVTAVWVSDPTIDPAVALENILRTDLPYEVEVIAEAKRFYKSHGASFSGWIVSVGKGLSHSDPIPNKPEAMAQLRHDVAERFHRPVHA
ncbi:hypothetical protein EEJ42_33450 [Streptomyces botrytidirepellens]|uniref:Uncharacterized protein n=1 Tax=Streptomyces botrytidirepellens TaxID=2486417 RepID=A0A3M8UT54_9ACTN|nr:hypothetical protein EEJ42_33450 [Streptomyces botrytidirepellens]